jgi:hypothetical protein
MTVGAGEPKHGEKGGWPPAPLPVRAMDDQGVRVESNERKRQTWQRKQ